jgi:hypothetical protein
LYRRGSRPDDDPPQQRVGDVLAGRNQQHFALVDAYVREIPAVVQRAIHDRGLDGWEQPVQRPLVLISQLATELLVAALVLARAAQRDQDGDEMASDLADIYCTSAMYRIEDLRRQLQATDQPDYGRVTAGLLTGSALSPYASPTPGADRGVHKA